MKIFLNFLEKLHKKYIQESSKGKAIALELPQKSEDLTQKGKGILILDEVGKKEKKREEIFGEEKDEKKKVEEDEKKEVKSGEVEEDKGEGRKDDKEVEDIKGKGKEIEEGREEKYVEEDVDSDDDDDDSDDEDDENCDEFASEICRNGIYDTVDYWEKLLEYFREKIEKIVNLRRETDKIYLPKSKSRFSKG
ncbi:unnamed protein product [Meloidogyne enterolobii]|uniref:Uncharacterized protein n=1 Tax=Meloidogyne enterolobii TaxID=390850 RepID=A0ACB1A0X1_MELEN